MTNLINRRTLLGAAGAGAISLPLQAQQEVSMTEEPASNSPVYRFAIGDIEATVLSDGQIAFPAYPTYAPDPTQAEVHASMQRHGVRPPNYVLDANGLLLRTGSRTILIDTGWGAFAPGVGRMAESLRLAGITPGDVDTVILSHIHPDHVGGLRHEDGSLVYTNAKVIVPEADLAQWRDTPDFGAMTVDEGFQAVFVGSAQSVFDLDDRLERVGDGFEAAPGVTLVAARGHTAGHSVVRITSGEATFLYAADAFHDPAFDIANPSWRTAFDYAPAEAEGARRRILDEAATEGSTIMAYHTPFPGFGYVERVSDGYAWRGGRWNVRIGE